MKCRTHLLAEQELLEAATHYHDQHPGLGAGFLEAFEEAIAFLRRHPRGAPIIDGELRRLVMPRFPYNIIYRIAGTTIRILAVSHHKRSPSHWADRS